MNIEWQCRINGQTSQKQSDLRVFLMFSCVFVLIIVAYNNSIVWPCDKNPQLDIVDAWFRLYSKFLMGSIKVVDF